MLERPAPRQVRTLVVVLGSLRGSDEIYRSILKHLVRPLGAELAVLAAIGGGGVSSDGWKDCLLIRHAKHLWWAEEHDDWGPPISRLVGNGWERNVTLLHNLWGGVYTRNLTLLQATRDPVTWKRLRPTWNSSILRRKTRRKTRLSGSGAILLYLRMLVLRHLDGLPEGTYTHVVLTRSDLYHICDHQPVGHTTQDEVYVPDGMIGGATGEHMSDRHHVFAFESRRRALAILPWLVDGSHPAPESYSTARNPFKPDLESVLPIYARAQGLSVRALTVRSLLQAAPTAPLPRAGAPMASQRRLMEAMRLSVNVRHHPGVGTARPRLSCLERLETLNECACWQTGGSSSRQHNSAAWVSARAPMRLMMCGCSGTP